MANPLTKVIMSNILNQSGKISNKNKEEMKLSNISNEEANILNNMINKNKVGLSSPKGEDLVVEKKENNLKIVSNKKMITLKDLVK